MSFGFRRASFAIFLVSLLAGCSVLVPSEPNVAAAALERASPPEPGAQRIYVTKPAPNGALIVYRTFGGSTPFSVGYGYLTMAGSDWQIHQVGEHGKAAANMGNAPVLLALDGPADARTFGIVVGLVREARIISVQLNFADGQVRNDRVVNELFGIYVEPNSAPCRIEFRDAADNVVQEYEIQADPAALELDPEIVEWAQRECQ